MGALKRGDIRRLWRLRSILLVGLILLASFFGGGASVQKYYLTCMRSGLEAKIITTANFFETYMTGGEEQLYSDIYTFTQEFEEKDRLELEFINTDGEITGSSFGLAAGTHPSTSDVGDALSGIEVSVFCGKDPVTEERIMSVSTPVYQPNGVMVGALRFVTSLRIADRRIVWYTVLICVAGILLSVLILLGSRVSIRAVLKPVRTLTETTKRIAAGGYGIQIENWIAEQDDEIGELAQSINNLSMQVSQTEKMQTEFLSSVSHELRTPLTAITGWGETLLSGEELNPEETRHGIGIMLNETRRLTDMVVEILEFTRIQDGRFRLNVQKYDLRGVFEDTIFMYGSRLRQEGIKLEYEDTDDEIPEINCDPERMKQVFLNLLDNAAKYGGSGGKISCGIQMDGEELLVYIRDYGPGIPEEEIPLVKKRFYRGSTTTVRGSGIGLAVCEEIVSLHNGELIIQNADDDQGGCLVTIHMPV